MRRSRHVDVTRRDAFETLMAPFEVASQSLMTRRQLLRRVDSKFVMSPDQLASVMSAIHDRYGLLRVGGEARSRYETLYLDTPELRCFHDHRRGRRPRHKVRYRHYPARQLSFLEIKSKRNEFLTLKHRRPIDFGCVESSADHVAFIGEHCDLPAAQLRPAMWTNFARTTLVGIDTEERITVDMLLELVLDDRTIHLDEVVILEVKQARFDARSPIMLALRELGLQMVSASKYCTGRVLHDRELRFNRLKPAIRRVEQLSAGRETTATRQSPSPLVATGVG